MILLANLHEPPLLRSKYKIIKLRKAKNYLTYQISISGIRPCHAFLRPFNKGIDNTHNISYDFYLVKYICALRNFLISLYLFHPTQRDLRQGEERARQGLVLDPASK